jgi:hypothetical protein
LDFSGNLFLNVAIDDDRLDLLGSDLGSRERAKYLFET